MFWRIELSGKATVEEGNMADTNLELVIDGDGHLVEDMDAIGEFMPEDLIPKDLVARQARDAANGRSLFITSSSSGSNHAGGALTVSPDPIVA